MEVQRLKRAAAATLTVPADLLDRPNEGLKPFMEWIAQDRPDLWAKSTRQQRRAMAQQLRKNMLKKRREEGRR